MTFALDPLVDARWEEFLWRHPRASVFHSRAWLEALSRTYGYEPTALTTTAHGPLENGLALCRVRTWTSRRLVSLPFSDHCDPLVDRPEELSALVGAVAAEMAAGRWQSFELRPWHTVPAGLAEAARFCVHTLDLSRSATQVFSGFHPSSTQRAIRRAEREGLSCETGTSERLLTSFYGLLRLARRRHGLPPQPREWFRNLVACLGHGAAIHVASKNGVPVAGVLTLSFKKAIVYKYGGSDSQHHRLGSMPYLFWHVIQEAQKRGFEEFDLGRSDLDQPGLIAFKDHLGAKRSILTYYRSPGARPDRARAGPVARAARRLVPHMPDFVLDLTGRLLYRHLG